MSPPCVISLVNCSFICVSPPYIYPSICTSCISLQVYVPFVCFSRRVYVPFVCIRSVYMCPPYVCALRVLLGFELLEQQADAAGQWTTQVNVCAYVSLIVGVRSVGFTGSCLCPRQLSHWGAGSEIYRLLFVSTSVGSLRYIYSFVSCPSILLSLRVRLLSYRQPRVHFFYYCLSMDARQDTTQRLT